MMFSATCLTPGSWILDSTPSLVAAVADFWMSPLQSEVWHE